MNMKAEYDFSKAKRSAVIPPTDKTRITIFLDDDILAAFQDCAEAQDKGHQTLINEILCAKIHSAQLPVSPPLCSNHLRKT